MGIINRLAVVCALAFATGPVRAETIRVAISDSPPISMKNAATGDYEGLAVEVVKRAGALAGFDSRLNMIAFGAMLTDLRDGKTDMIVMSGSEERRRNADFSTPFTRHGEALLARREDASAYKNLEDLAGKTVGSNAGGGWIDAAAKAGAKVVTFGSAELALGALQRGEVDAVVGNSPTYKYLMKSGAFTNVRMVETYAPRQVNELALGVRKGETALLARVDAALGKLDAAGTLAQLRAKWGF